MGFSVQEAGLFTTVQDGGRTGYQQFGVSPSGPMDEEALFLANMLVGNPRGTEGLEMTFSGVTLSFERDNVIAVTGADMQPALNGEPVPMYRAVIVRRGDVLKMGFARSGSRGYIAFAGGLQIPEVMGSKSTLAGKNLGGLEGRSLRAGDRIRFVSPVSSLPDMENRALPIPVYPEKEVVLRVIPGPQDDMFSEEELRRFFWYGADITDEFDRQGCRLLREEPVRHLKDGNIISDGISFGSIQVPTNGQPIIMLADRQTVGGYAKIGTVISTDLPKIAQSRPGMHVRFIKVSMDLAQQLYIARMKKYEELETRFAR